MQKIFLKMPNVYMVAVTIQHCESCLFPLLLVGGSLRVNLNHQLLIMAKFRFPVFRKREGSGGDTGRGIFQTRQSRREKERKAEHEGERRSREGDGVKR